MTIDFERILEIPASVLFQQVSGEAVLLDMDSEQYFGLDEVGTRIWQLIAEHGRLAAVYATLLDEYAVQPEVLKQDLVDLVALLADKGLIVVAKAAQDPPV